MTTFLWSDGGRAACGYVGFAGDCVTRAIAIATGNVYRDVYKELGLACQKSPRNGVRSSHADNYLRQLGWRRIEAYGVDFTLDALPSGRVIVDLRKPDSHKCGHFCAVIDHTLYDTWNPLDDDFVVSGYWCPPVDAEIGGGPSGASLRQVHQACASREQELTQLEFDKIIRRLRALDNTASNDASTEGEKHNALRMMQSLMLRHNLSREDIVDEDNVDSVYFTRTACPLNGRRACGWEASLAAYVTVYIFPSVQFYQATKGHRTFYWFYGPRDDVGNTITLFRELLLTIATAAQLRYGNFSRGSGASYAEGYVAGLPRTTRAASTADGATAPSVPEESNGLILTRTLALKNAARDWLALECDVHLVKCSGRGRSHFDGAAAGRGKRDGAKHEIQAPGRQLRIESSL